MPSSVPPAAALEEFLGSSTRHTRRIEIYEQDGLTRWAKDTVVRLKDGSVSVDYSRDERRTLDLTLSNEDGVLINSPNEFWYDKIIKVYRGVEVNEQQRLPHILVISDKTGTEQLAQSFRATMVEKGYGDVQVNVLAADYTIDIAPYDIIVGLSGASAAQTSLLVQAYRAGKSVYVQDTDAVAFVAGAYTTEVAYPGTTQSTVNPLLTTAHPVSKGWSAFALTLAPSSQRINQSTNPNAETSTANWTNTSTGTVGTIALTRVTDPYAGTYAFSISASALATTTANNVSAYHSLTASAGQFWSCSAQVRGATLPAGVTYVMRLEFYNGATFISGVQSASATATAYGLLSISGTVAPANTTAVRVMVRAQGGTTAGAVDIHFDNVQAEIVSGAGVAPGSYFEGGYTNIYNETYSWSGTPNLSTSIVNYTTTTAYTVPSSEYTLIAPTVPGGTVARIAALEDPTSGGRAVVLSGLINYAQFEVAAFESFLASAMRWLNTVSVLDSWEVQIGEFMIDRISEPHFPYEFKITGRDYTKKCMLSKYAYATQFVAGISLESLIATIAAAAGIVKRLLPTTGVVVGKNFFFERGTTRWEAMKQIADAYNYEIYFDAAGYLVLRTYRDPATTAPALWINTGADGQIASYEKSTSDARLYNHVLVTGESSDATTANVYAEAINNSLTSPTSVTEIGDRLYQYSSSFITTTAQAQSVADSFLAVHALEEFNLNFETLILPWLEVGDIMGWTDPDPAAGDPSAFLLTSLTLPLSLAPMSGVGARVKIAGS